MLVENKKIVQNHQTNQHIFNSDLRSMCLFVFIDKIKFSQNWKWVLRSDHMTNITSQNDEIHSPHGGAGSVHIRVKILSSYMFTYIRSWFWLPLVLICTRCQHICFKYYKDAEGVQWMLCMADVVLSVMTHSDGVVTAVTQADISHFAVTAGKAQVGLIILVAIWCHDESVRTKNRTVDQVPADEMQPLSDKHKISQCQLRKISASRLVICIILLRIKQEHNSNKSQWSRFTLLSSVISRIFVLITVDVEEGVGKHRNR